LDVFPPYEVGHKEALALEYFYYLTTLQFQKAHDRERKDEHRSFHLHVLRAEHQRVGRISQPYARLPWT
jgi:hypothetical protein